MVDFIQEIISTIKQNKLRTFLTGFAVAWGIFILIALLGMGNGMFNAFELQTKRFDSNSLALYAGYTSKPIYGFERGRRIEFDESDIDLLLNEVSDVLINGGGKYSLPATNISTPKDYIVSNVSGVYPNYSQTEVLKIKQGRFINDMDINLKRKVIVIYDEAAQTLLGLTDPIGKQLVLNSIPYTVIGVIESQGDKDTRSAYIPFSTLKMIFNKDKLPELNFSLQNIKTEQDCDLLETKIRNVLALKHSFDPTDKSAFYIWNRFKTHLEMQNAIKYLTIMIWVIGVLTLLSGIVGVSNIMLITVKERTREFGIRKALGAKPWSILKSVILESIVITTFFGYLGMLLGIGATEWIDKMGGEQVMDMGAFKQTMFVNPSVDISVAIQATFAMIIAGTIAGLIPALKAVKIKPIEALNSQ